MSKKCDLWMYSVNLGVQIRSGDDCGVDYSETVFCKATSFFFQPKGAVESGCPKE